MELLSLVSILALIFVLACFFCKRLEAFTPNPYLISWQKPTDDGGDSTCCGYDWQINDGAIDSGSVPTGTNQTMTVQTTKLDWNTTYKISVRAINMFGPGDWTVANLSTGDGVLSSIKIASAIDINGNITKPISVGSDNISIRCQMTLTAAGVAAMPGPFLASALVVVNRLVALGPATTVVLNQRLNLANGSSAGQNGGGALLTFWDDFASELLPPFTFATGDVLTATIIVWDSKTGNVATESSADTTVTQGVPSNVSGITLSYQHS
jgi:hypothetical protein